MSKSYKRRRHISITYILCSTINESGWAKCGEMESCHHLSTGISTSCHQGPAPAVLYHLDHLDYGPTISLADRPLPGQYSPAENIAIGNGVMEWRRSGLMEWCVMEWWDRAGRVELYAIGLTSLCRDLSSSTSLVSTTCVPEVYAESCQ